jgi:hypothetical protein
MNYQIDNYNIILTQHSMNLYNILTGEYYEYIYKNEIIHNYNKRLSKNEIPEYLYYIFEDKSSYIEINKYDNHLKILVVDDYEYNCLDLIAIKKINIVNNIENEIEKMKL